AASMPKRHEVRVGICGPGMEWYLRYFIDASGGHASLDLTVPPEWEQDFHGVMEALAPVSWARSSAAEYYQLIRRRATPVSAGRDISRISREAAVASSARFEGLADNLSFGGGFGSLFKGKFVGAVGVGILIILGYLLLSNLHFS
ncbi:MAG: hypothetical protein ABIW76_01550, partial [Fibrobacteria bacterium]